MHIVDFSLNRPVTIFMIFTCIVILGIISLINLPVELMPNVNMGRITVTTNIRGGLSSEDIEKRISRLMEDALGDTSHLNTMLSISKEGESKVIMEFEPEANMDYVSLEIREKLAKIRNKLPREAERSVVAQYGYGEFPIIGVTFVSDKISQEDLRKIADTTLKEKFMRIDGVARIETVGGREEKIIIEVDEKKLAALKLSLREVLDIIGSANINLVGGDLILGEKKYLVRSVGEFYTLEDIQNIGIKITEEGNIIRLKEIGEVKLSYLEPRELGRINLKPSVTLYVFKKSLSNTLSVCKNVEREAEKMGKELKEHINVIIPFNKGEFIERAIENLKSSLVTGSIWSVLVLLLFLRSISSILILGLSLPLSMLFTFFCMRSFGISLNVMTLAGLCLGAGMLVDSSIVVMENTFKSLETNGTINKNNALIAAKEVSLAIFASILTTIIVFVPFMFLNKETQRLYSGIALSITYSLIGSLFVSLTAVPLYCYLLLRNKQNVQTQFFHKIEYGFKKSLDFILSLRYIIIILALAGAGTTFFLLEKLDKEFIGMPEEDEFTIFIQMPTGTKLEITDKVVKQVEEVVDKYKESKDLQNYTTHIEPYSAKIYARVASLGKRKKEPSQIIEELRKKTDALEPAFIYYEEPQEVESKEVIVEFLGYDYKILKSLARESASYLKGIEGLTDVKIRMREGGPQMDIILNKNKLAMWELTVDDVSTELHGKLRGLIPTRFHPGTESYLLSKENKYFEDLPISLFSEYAREIEIISRLQEKYRKKFSDIEELNLISNERELKLSQVADFKFGLSPSEIWRKNKKRMVQVSANKGKLALGKVANDIAEKLKNIKLPEGYTWKFGENYEKLVRNQKELRFAFIFAIILVYLVLASMFENLLQPFIILSTIPLAGIGSVSALYLKKEPIGMGVLIGGLILVGIVVNNGIILVDHINQLRKNKFSLKTALVEGTASRLRPVLMTTLSTILPLLPLLIFKSDASPLWAPLALTVATGLTASCLFTLYVVPCLYMLFPKK